VEKKMQESVADQSSQINPDNQDEPCDAYVRLCDQGLKFQNWNKSEESKAHRSWAWH